MLFMALINDTFYDLYEGLKHNFLFKNDLNSIHMLLNLYDIEDNIRNIFPKYVSIKFLRNHITRFLKDRRGNQLIALNLGELVHEDINRLELLLYLEGYKDGYVNIKEANDLEKITVKSYSVNELYYRKYLFHFESNSDEILKLKEKLFNKLNQKENASNRLQDLINEYFENVIKTKVFSLNKYLDKQLTIDYESSFTIISEDDTFLTNDDLTLLYNEVNKIISRNGMRLYKDAYWNGLNDRVLKRYK
ncbi:MAG: hypothetical protein RBR71_11610 [Gudongella sp.]|nr:hypothetical protein [Gudongella sp.]